jgi:hypothetical protein
MPFVEEKPAIQSKVILGSATSLVSVLVAFLAAKAKLPPEVLSQLGNEVLLPVLVSVGGSLVALVSRFFSDSKISGLLK